MSKLTHIKLIELGRNLGYKFKEGICHGFSAMLCQAWLANDAENFFKRLQFLETYNNNDINKDSKRLIDDINDARQFANASQAENKTFDTLDEKTKFLLEIPAFFEGIELYQQPAFHTDLFANQTICQGNVDTVYPFARSKRLEQDDLSIALEKIHVFDPKTLIKYFIDMQHVFESSNSNAPLLLSSGNHSVALRYNLKKKLWDWVDINDFAVYPGLEAYSREINIFELVQSIFFTFGRNGHVVVDTVALTKSSEQHILKTKLNDVNNEYPINPEHASIYDAEGNGLLYVACFRGQLDVVRKLLKECGDIDVNHVNKDGFSPLYVACQNGHSEIVRELLVHSYVQPNQKTNARTTLLDIDEAIGIAKTRNHHKIVDCLKIYNYAISHYTYTKSQMAEFLALPIPSRKKKNNMKSVVLSQNLSQPDDVLNIRREQQQRYKSEINSIKQTSLSGDEKNLVLEALVAKPY